MTAPRFPFLADPVQAGLRPAFPPVSARLRAGWLLLFALLGLAGWQPAAVATPPEVAFPAAANIRPGGNPVGPQQIVPQPNTLSQFVHPDDFVILDPSGATPANHNITVINGGFGGTFGATTVVASNSVGSGVAFNGTGQACISPSQQLYYWDSTLAAFVAIDLTQATYPRTLVPVPSNTALVPGSVYTSAVPGVVWDYSTNTILYIDNGISNAKSTIPRGIYRLNPVTGTNTLYAPFTAGMLNSIAIKQDGSAVYGFYGNGSTLGVNASVYQIAPTTGATTAVDGGAALYGSTLTNPRYVEAVGISWDIFNQKITLFDVGDDQTSARILRIDPVAKTRTFISNGSAGPTATYGGTVISAPSSGFMNTAGRLLYTEEDAGITLVFPATIAVGSPTSTRVGSSQFTNTGYFSTYIPPTLPVITTPTAVAGANGTTATLGANVTSAGTAIVTPTIQTRGVVYSQTSVNSNPTLGGTGVTTLASSAAAGTFTVSASGLTAGTLYSYAGYVSTFYGTVYTPVGTFTTATSPSVATNAATAITGVSAALNGNVSSDGGGTLTARGFVYSVTSTNSAPVLSGTGVTNLPDATATTGAFADTASGLANGTQYSFRAYATNGVGTTYGSVLTFTTIAPPTANGQSVNVPFNTATPITLTGTDPNTPAQTLTYSVVTAPAHGTLSGTAPNLTYTPTVNYQGTDSFTFKTTNTSGLSSNNATVTITVGAGTPTATAQNVNVPFNTATAVTLTGTDPDSPALALTYSIVTAPTHGTLSGTSPNLTYTPTAGYQGADSFTFTVSNGQKTSAAATVSITVGAGTPTAQAQALNVNLNLPRAITLAGTDPDSPALALTYTVVTAPTNGTLSGTAPNLTYTPNTGYTGADSFTFTVSNGQNTSAAATVSLTVIGQPVITGFSPASGPVGTLVTITGTNLQNAVGVNFFRNVAGTSFTGVSSTQVTVRVPSGASTGILTVLSGSGSNNSSTKFTVTP